MGKQDFLTFTQYYNQTTTVGKKRWVKAVTIICFLKIAICIASFVSEGTEALIEAVAYLIGTVLIGVRKNWIFSLAFTAHLLFRIVMPVGLGEKIGAIVALVCGVGATIILYKAEKAYIEYNQQAMQSQWINITRQMNLDVSRIYKRQKIEKLVAIICVVGIAAIVAFCAMAVIVIWDMHHWD